jgi:hypothetical protein
MAWKIWDAALWITQFGFEWRCWVWFTAFYLFRVFFSLQVDLWQWQPVRRQNSPWSGKRVWTQWHCCFEIRFSGHFVRLSPFGNSASFLLQLSSHQVAFSQIDKMMKENIKMNQRLSRNPPRTV